MAAPPSAPTSGMAAMAPLRKLDFAHQSADGVAAHPLRRGPCAGSLQALLAGLTRLLGARPKRDVGFLSGTAGQPVLTKKLGGVALLLALAVARGDISNCPRVAGNG